MDTLSEYILTADTLHSEMSHREYNPQNVLGTGYHIVLLKGKMFGNNNIESTADVPGELELSRIDCTGVLAFTPTSIRSFSSFLLLSSTISLTSRISRDISSYSCHPRLSELHCFCWKLLRTPRLLLCSLSQPRYIS